MESNQNYKPGDFGLFEFGFDKDISPKQLSNLLKVFPSEKRVHNNIMNFRDSIGYVDMKRGELYPEVIASVQRLRRTIANAYGIDVIQAQPNFACNGCIDALMTYLRISWSAQKCFLYENLLNEIKFIIKEKRAISENEINTILSEGQLITKPKIVVAVPTYFRYYSATESKQIDLIKIPFKSDYSYPFEEIMNTLSSEDVSALIICTPNNPTGMPVPDGIIHKILTEISDRKIIAIDRTCANVEKEISTPDLLKKYSNKKLVVFHSFSKYYSMSHIRIGFSVFSNTVFSKEVEQMLPFGLNLEGALKATKILSKGPLKPSSTILKRIKSNQLLLNQFQNESKGFNLTPFTSNYALMHLPDNIDSASLSDVLLNEGIFVMPGHQTPEANPNVIRIHTGGEPETTKKMISVILKNFK